MDLSRCHDCHRHSHGDLHHVRWYQGRHLDRFDSSLDHDWERVNCACFALLRNSRRLARDRATPRRISSLGSHHNRSRSGQTWLGPGEEHVRDGVHNLCRVDWGSVHHDGNTRHGSGHGAANVDCARHTPEPSLPYLLRARRHPNRVHVPQHWVTALGLLSSPSRSDAAENA